MELVDRYLQAVEAYLPKALAKDIIAELKDSLLSQIEEREAELARALNADEQQALIKQSGHPMLVAGRYLPQQHLIGPSVFPFWWYSIRLVLTIVGMVYVVLAGVAMINSGEPVQAALQAVFGFAGTALVYIAAVTLLFWCFEHYQFRFGFLNNWQPAKLAPVKDHLQIKRTDTLFDLVLDVLFILWWCGALNFPAMIFHDGVVIPYGLSAAWTPYWWGILALAVFDGALALQNLLSPVLRTERLLARILLNATAIGVAYALFQQDVLIVVTDATAEFGRYGSAETVLNRLMHGALVVLALFFAADISQDVRRLLKLR